MPRRCGRAAVNGTIEGCRATSGDERPGVEAAAKARSPSQRCRRRAKFCSDDGRARDRIARRAPLHRRAAGSSNADMTNATSRASSVEVATSSDAPAARFGQDATFRLPNPKLRMLGLGLFLVALGAAPFIIDKRDGRAGLMMIVGAVLAAIGAWFLYTAIRLFGAKEGQATVTARELQITLPGAATRTLELESIVRVLHATRSGQRQHMLFETDDGKSLVLPAANTVAEDETALGGMVLRRAGLRRAGVKTRAELAAAEAYLSSAAEGMTPFAVHVVTKGNAVMFVGVTLARDQLGFVEAGGLTVDDDMKRHLFVPEPVLAVLKGEEPLLAGAKPLRGVS